MDYREDLSPWCVVCQFPNFRHTIVARCRQRSFAEEHMRVLRQINPAQSYELIFDPLD